MTQNIKELLKQIIPKPILINAWAFYSRSKAYTARQAFDSAPKEPQWLTIKELEQLQAHYSLADLSYCYDRESLENRARKRVSELISMARRQAGSMDYFLELGSWDGMVCSLLREMGKVAIGIDYRTHGFTDQAIASGTLLAGMDARYLGFGDNTFDFVFSYNSFEHFRDPNLVLSEAARVVRPGGSIFMSFGPLWLSPKGAHQYKSITVPYCECLFPLTLIEDFARERGLNLIDFAQMNKWTLSQYRDLWSKFSDRLDLVTYYETYNADHVDLIIRYPSCFKSKTAVFDDLIISNIDVLFIKHHRSP